LFQELTLERVAQAIMIAIGRDGLRAAAGEQ